MKVAEPEPGRVLTESDMNSSAVTTFAVSARGGASLARISTAWDGASGIGGLFERLSRREYCAPSTLTNSSDSTRTRANNAPGESAAPDRWRKRMFRKGVTRACRPPGHYLG
jgi:hypothetical protein